MNCKKGFVVSSAIFASVALLSLQAPRVLAEEARIHTVSQGEYLYVIAQQYGVSVQDIRNWNNLSSDDLYNGDQLIISTAASSTSTVEMDTAAELPVVSDTSYDNTDGGAEGEAINTLQTSSTVSHYTVKAGDTLYSIASRYGVSLAELQDWNNLSSNYIYTGNRLAVAKPAGSNGGNTSAPTKPEAPSNPSTGDNSNNTTTTHYTVKSGDSLWSIANAHGVTVKNLQDWNNLSSNYIYTGNRLVVAKPAESTGGNTSVPTKPEAPSNPSTGDTGNNNTTTHYTVKSGDSLWSIANAHGVTVKKLQDWNNLSSNYIYTGNRLVVAKPAGSTGGNTSVPTKPEAPSNPSTGDNSNNTTTTHYTVKSGDSLWSIANAHGVTVKNLQDWNNLSSNYIYTGNRLAVTQPQAVGSGNNTEEEIPANSYSVFIDAGHGGRETGAINNGVYEKDLNLNVSKQVADKLRAQGYSVFEARRDDSYIQLHERDDWPNELETDIFVSIHHNAMPQSARGTASGIVTLYHDRSIDEPNYRTPSHHTNQMLSDGRRLAQALQNGMVNATGGKNQGIRPQNLHVTRTTDMPAALVELGFMDHKDEFKKLTDATYQAKLIDGLVNGINHYFGR